MLLLVEGVVVVLLHSGFDDGFDDGFLFLLTGGEAGSTDVTPKLWLVSMHPATVDFPAPNSGRLNTSCVWCGVVWCGVVCVCVCVCVCACVHACVFFASDSSEKLLKSPSSNRYENASRVNNIDLTLF